MDRNGLPSSISVSNIGSVTTTRHELCCCLTKEGGERVGRSGSLELLEGLDGFVDVGFGVAEVVVGEDAVSVLVQNIGDAARKQTKGGLGDPKVGAGGIALVGQNAKGESLLLGELLLGLDALSGDPDDLGPELLADLVDAGVESLGLLGAAGGGVGGIKIDHQGLLEGRPGDGLSVLVDQAEVGGGLADGQVEGRGRGGGGSGLGHKGVGGGREAGGGDEGGNKLHGGY